MMHEIAHCKQMNHSKAFWKVRDGYAAEMRELWAKGYTGEGIWGRGRDLSGGGFVPGGRGVTDSPGEDVEAICGGAYRSGGRRRKKKISSKEAKERRIKKKFGANGMHLGEDEVSRMELEGGRMVQGKPRVAKSKRGRELRAQAALARFETQKVKEEGKERVKEEEDEDENSETESEYEEDVKIEPASNLVGSQMLDKEGRGLFKVEDEDGINNIKIKEEMQELQDISQILSASTSKQMSRDIERKPQESQQVPNLRTSVQEFQNTKSETQDSQDMNHIPTAMSGTVQSRYVEAPLTSGIVYPSSSNNTTTSAHPKPQITIKRLESLAQPRELKSKPPSGTAAAGNNSSVTCPICSLVNEPFSWVCAACAHVLRPDKSPGSWLCKSSACEGSSYRNAADCGICGVCGARKGS